jgi:hypothetical protein
MNNDCQTLAATTAEPRRTRWVPWLILFAAVVAARLLLPFRDSDTLLVHQAIVDSLLSGHNWGRQALVAALEYPLLPTLGLLAARVLFGAGIAPLFLVALAQSLAVCYLLRLRPTLPRRWALGVLLVVLGTCLPDVRAALTALDPNWVAAVPFCAAVFHLSRWFREHGIRDAVLCAVNAGLLVFCGMGGGVVGLALALVLAGAARKASSGAGVASQGLGVLVWAPLLYCLSLWFLWNWLILGDLLFCVKHLWSALTSVSAGAFLKAGGWALLTAPAVAWAGALFALSSAAGRDRRAVAGMIVLCTAAAAARAACTAAGLLPGAATLLAVCAGVAALARVPVADATELAPALLGRRWLRFALLGVGLLILAADMAWMPVPDPVAEASFVTGAPPPLEITRLIDRDWPRSRTTVYGVRLPALYHDPQELRFVARMDYQQGLFIEQAQHEVMHLLLPPPDGRFYPRGNNAFSGMHRSGTPALLLEKQWDSGWQLWRCVIFPENESRLQHLK